MGKFILCLLLVSALAASGHCLTILVGDRAKVFDRTPRKISSELFYEKWHDRVPKPHFSGDGDPHYVDFLPTYEGSLKDDGTWTTWKTDCFSNVAAQFVFTNPEKTEGQLNVKAKGRKCTDIYMFATVWSYDFHDFVMEGDFSISFKSMSAEESADIQARGLEVFLVKDNIFEMLECIYDLVVLVQSGPEGIIDFYRKMMNFTLVPRKEIQTPIPEDQLPDLATMVLLDQEWGSAIIVWASGGHASHSVLLIRNPDDNQMYTLQIDGWTDRPEVPGCENFTYAKFIKSHIDRGDNIMMLPVDPVLASKVDRRAIFDRYNTLAKTNMPFGFKNFAFAQIDTPEDNFSPPLSAELIAVASVLLDPMLDNWVMMMMGEGLNQRIGNHACCLPGNCSEGRKACLTISELYQYFDAHNLTLGDLLAMPEDDDYIYSDLLPSRVCSCFVTDLLQAGGLEPLSSVRLAVTEITPKNLYEFDVYDKEYKKPDACLTDSADFPYCQLLGKYRIPLPTYNSITPYDHMFERCASKYPDYKYSPPGC